MRYRSDLELLVTLDASAIERACTSPDCLPELISLAIDESLEFDDCADLATSSGDDAAAAFCTQEAAAWRATAALLREMRHAYGHGGRRRGAA
ncbi:hypothetical protein [Gordonia soli]|nr:hypothetical protein [Gordonia soli]